MKKLALLAVVIFAAGLAACKPVAAPTDKPAAAPTPPEQTAPAVPAPETPPPAEAPSEE